MIAEQIAKQIKKVLGVENVNLEIPEREGFGDYYTNIAMTMSAKTKTTKSKAENSRELAADIIKKLKKDRKLSHIVGKIEVAGPGFINFWLTRSVLVNELSEIISKKDSYGKSDLLKGKRIMFEFGQPNTHKLPHIGHLYSYIYGGSMTRILEANGADVFRANYQGDVGPHVAKCLWAYLHEKPAVPQNLEDKVKLLQTMYQSGVKAYDEDENAKEEIDELNQKIYARDTAVLSVWEETRDWSTSYYKQFEERLGVVYDRYYFESEVYENGIKIVKDNIGKVFRESQGAVIFEGGRQGLHDRVFLTSRGTPTYEAKDMYLQVLKYKEWPFDSMFISTANEQNEYFKVIFKALETLNPEFKGKLHHIGFGMVQLKTGKMSSRTGEFIGAVELVENVVDAIRTLVGTRDDVEGKEKISEMVGVGAVKYSFLKNNPLQDTKFDITESISKEGNSGPYLQYAFARTQSIIRKKGEVVLVFENTSFNKEEEVLLRSFIHFSEAVENAAKNYSPNILANYLFDLAQKYNTFYNMHKIIGSDEEKLRLAITVATGQVIKNGLTLLGIESPEKM